jgi:glutamate-5-semialdehyde dehydrogenase
MTTKELLLRAKQAAPLLAQATTDVKNRALSAMADRLLAQTDSILKENAADVEAARETIDRVMIDRLTLTRARIADMAEGIRQVAALPDPVGRVLRRVERPNGLVIEKTAVPLGVVAIIYESRPNVTSDAAVLAIKSGNACVLRGGKEAHRSAVAIVDALRQGLSDAGLAEDLLLLVEDTTRQSAVELMEGVGLVDLLIPRGSAGLIHACLEHSKVPCIQTGSGICHVFVDESADFAMACRIVENAKTSRPSACNAEESCLVHEKIAPRFLPMLQKELVEARAENPVELRLDRAAQEMIAGTAANDTDFDTEFLGYILAVRIVPDVEAAIAHIAAHSTHHSECIVTRSEENAQKFIAQVDSAAVYVNASTRFTDGGEFGLGCEMGISTQKLHARGPMGLEELTTYKYIIRGDGQIR